MLMNFPIQDKVYMAKIYEFPKSGHQSAPQKEKSGKVSFWFTRLYIGYFLKNFAANCIHYPLLAVLLLLIRFRYPIAVIGGGYCLYFLSEHHNSLWITGDYSALYCLLGVCAPLLSFVLVNLMESARPFHRLFRANRQNKSIHSANDEMI